MGFDWKKTLGTVAPALATALGGTMAGVAVTMACKAVGLEPGATEDDLASVVASGDPSVLLKLKEADHAFKIEMERLQVDIYKADVEDRGSARALGIAKGLMAQTVLSTVFVCGFVYILGLLFGGHSEVESDMMQPAMYVLGILSAGIIQIMNFWFGSSSGSKTKTNELAKMSQGR